jgi:outer membrane biogenesis lipoprotein LolB
MQMMRNLMKIPLNTAMNLHQWIRALRGMQRPTQEQWTGNFVYHNGSGWNCSFDILLSTVSTRFEGREGQQTLIHA